MYSAQTCTMRSALLIWLIVCLAACSGTSSTRVLAPAPNLYAVDTGSGYPDRLVPPKLRRLQTEVLFLTDRKPIFSGSGEISGYGQMRSDSMVFGVSLVEYGDLESWPQLVAETNHLGQTGLTRLDTVYLQELARFPATPLPFERRGEQLVTLPEAAEVYHAQARVMRLELSKRLRMHGLSRVSVFIHGVNNEFEDGIGTLANLWHYSGRQSLPIAYSWPAGSRGLLKYFHDLESGEFSVFHVKEFLRVLASVPEIAKIDIIAHSRGNAVMTAALRELIIEARGGGRDPKTQMKTGVLIMAAPDLDTGVARQRLTAERFGAAFDQVTIYVNPDDPALALSKLLGNVTRLGSLREENFTQSDFESLARAGTINFVLVDSAGNDLGHAYFRENPAVMSDIVLTLRSRQLPGTSFRPLEQIHHNVWALHQNYPGKELPLVLDRRQPER